MKGIGHWNDINLLNFTASYAGWTKKGFLVCLFLKKLTLNPSVTHQRGLSASKGVFVFFSFVLQHSVLPN